MFNESDEKKGRARTLFNYGFRKNGIMTFSEDMRTVTYTYLPNLKTRTESIIDVKDENLNIGIADKMIRSQLRREGTLHLYQDE